MNIEFLGMMIFAFLSWLHQTDTAGWIFNLVFWSICFIYLCIKQD